MTAPRRQIAVPLGEQPAGRVLELPPSLPQAPVPVNGNVLLAGAFGQGNPGDEALLAAFARGLPGAVLSATSADPAATAREHDVAAVARHDPWAMLRALRAADAVVFAGGTIFKRLHPASGRPPLALLAQAAAVSVAVKALRRPLAIVGVGAGDLEGAAARRLARIVVRAADLLILRDDESATRLAAAGAPTPLRVGADAAWTLADPPAAAPRVAGAPIVVALSHLAGGTDLPERLAAALDPLLRAGLPLALLPWDRSGQDAALARAVVTRIAGPITVLEPPADLDEAIAGFAQARLVVGLRFHALIAAAAAGTPFVAVVHEPKLAAAARRLAQPAIGAGAPAPDVAAAIAGALRVAAPDPAAVAVERERAEDAFRLLRVLLAGGRTREADAAGGLALRPEEWL